MDEIVRFFVERRFQSGNDFDTSGTNFRAFANTTSDSHLFGFLRVVVVVVVVQTEVVVVLLLLLLANCFCVSVDEIDPFRDVVPACFPSRRVVTREEEEEEEEEELRVVRKTTTGQTSRNVVVVFKEAVSYEYISTMTFSSNLDSFSPHIPLLSALCTYAHIVVT